jgi:hypothetical protein
MVGYPDVGSKNYGKYPILILMKTPIVKPVRLISGLPK